MYTRNDIITFARFAGVTDPDKKLALWLNETGKESDKRLQVMHIISRVTGISVKDIQKPSRGKKEIYFARHFYCYYAKKTTPFSLEKIGEMIGRDHSTVLNSIESITNLIDVQDALIWEHYKQLEILFKQ